MGGHENYAPCAPGDLVAKGYDYWALGHVHQFQVLQQRPHVVFPGNLQGRHIRETGAKGAVLVSVRHGEVADLSRVHCDVVRWAQVPVDIGEARGVGDAVDRIRAALESAVEREADGRLLACRVLVQGRSAVHETLLAAEERLLAEARAAAVGLGAETAWVERVVVATLPVADADALAARSDALGDLQRMLAQAGTDGELVARLREELGQLLRRLPYELRQEAEPDSILGAALADDLTALIDTVTPHLSSRLVAEPD